MAAFKCKMCGGDLQLEAGLSVCECEYCGTKQTVPNGDSEKKMTLFGRAGRLLRGCEFDKAAGVFETIVADYPDEAEAYWGLVLCHYGIEYVDDPATGKKVPTCHRSSFDSVLDDDNFEQACENADVIARRVYRDEARAIDELRKSIIEVSGKEEPYDIFISYKETDYNGNRTLDSVLAQDMYDALTEKGYRVFFSRITLEDKLGKEYEPYIFAALNSAKIMLVVGTEFDHFDAVWVKNEWSRFLKMIASGQKKTLIPCYKNMDAYDMPKEFAKLTAQDMGKIGAMQDLVRGVGKLLPKEIAPMVQETVVVQQFGVDHTANLLKRVAKFLKDGDWNRAREYCEKVLDIDSDNAEAYLGLLMVQWKIHAREELKNFRIPLEESEYWDELMDYGDSALIAEMKGYNTQIITRNNDAAYDEAQKAMELARTEGDFKGVSKKFRNVSGWKDADAKAEECLVLAESARKEKIYEEACKVLTAAEMEEDFQAAADAFATILGWKDTEGKIDLCEKKIAQLREDERIWQEKLPEIWDQYEKDYSEQLWRVAVCDKKIENIRQRMEKTANTPFPIKEKLRAMLKPLLIWLGIGVILGFAYDIGYDFADAFLDSLDLGYELYAYRVMPVVANVIAFGIGWIFMKKLTADMQFTGKMQYVLPGLLVVSIFASFVDWGLLGVIYVLTVPGILISSFVAFLPQLPFGVVCHYMIPTIMLGVIGLEKLTITQDLSLMKDEIKVCEAEKARTESGFPTFHEYCEKFR